MIRPLFIRGARKIGVETLKTAGGILSDISMRQPGQEVGTIIKKRVSETVDRNLKGSGAGLKRGVKRKRIQSSLRPRAVKREKRDIFD